MKSLENSFNFDDLNNKLQNIGNQLKESITQAFIEIMKFNMNQNKNEEEQNEIEVNNKILTENNFESLLEINKNILEKLDKIHKEKFTINSNSKEEENSNKLNNYLTHNFQNLLNEINLISNLVVDLKKNNQVICKENTNNDLLKVPLSDIEGIKNHLESSFKQMLDVFNKSSNRKNEIENLKDDKEVIFLSLQEVINLENQKQVTPDSLKDLDA